MFHDKCMYEKRFDVSTDSSRAFVINGSGQILLLKRNSSGRLCDKWCLPGGTIENNETPYMAICREIIEETTLEITGCKFLFSMESCCNNNASHPHVTWYFKVSVTGKISINYESREYKWVPVEEFMSYEPVYGATEAFCRYREINYE